MKNQIFQRAINSLLHPVSIGAIGLLLWNDHWLRLYYPSWWTGKLGDFAWLVFAPFVCAAVLAWIVPQRLKDHQRIVGLSSCLIIGAWFSLAKTIPAFHDLTVTAWEATINGPISQRLDPTDLLALPALLISWQVWRRAKAPSFSRSQLTIAVFALAIGATLASDDGDYHPYVDAGVASICALDHSLDIYVRTGGNYVSDSSSSNTYKAAYDIYTSTDGGEYWQLSGTENVTGESKPESGNPYCSQSQDFITTSTVQYRWKPAQSIERSTDAGQHWTTDFDLYQLRQDVRAEYKSTSNGWDSEVDTSLGPHSGLIDPTTGNVVFAMGWDGVLVRTNAGEWHWAAVGDYHLDELSDLGQVQKTLFWEWWEAGALIILVFTSTVVYLHRGIYDGEKGIVAFGWLGWVFIACFLLPDVHPDRSTGFFIGLLALPLLIFAALLLIFTIFDFIRNYRRLLLPVLGIGVAVAALYLFPIFFWTQGTIARYVSAMELAMLLTGAGLWSGFNYLRNIAPKAKRKHTPVAENFTEESI